MIPLVQTRASLVLRAIFALDVVSRPPFLLMLFRESHYNSPMHTKYRKTLTGNVNNMPKINARTDVCVLKSVNFLQRCSKATVWEAMIVGGFSEEEQQDRAKQGSNEFM
jgi:hypothetical protein